MQHKELNIILEKFDAGQATEREQLVRRHEITARVIALDIDARHWAWDYGTILITKGDLPKLRKEFGRLKVDGYSTHLDYEDNGNINIHVVAEDAVDIEDMTFFYTVHESEMPNLVDGRCKVKKSENNFKTYEISCEVG
tara:strand:+ start:532 stop:948 length:417 start_codon:yes stop_codon:yes gene_type:complete